MAGAAAALGLMDALQDRSFSWRLCWRRGQAETGREIDDEGTGAAGEEAGAGEAFAASRPVTGSLDLAPKLAG